MLVVLCHNLHSVQLQGIIQEEGELPPWARKEKERKLASMEKKDLPFGVYLLGSAVVAIAAVSWFRCCKPP